jgi:MFS family permease
MAMYAVTLMLGAIFIRTPFSFGWAVFGHMVVAGFFLSASGALAQMLLPRIKFAQFFSASAAITAVGTIVLSTAMGYLLDKTHTNYRLTYAVSSVLAFTALGVMIVVHRKFMALGGPKGYVAPDPTLPTHGFPVVQTYGKCLTCGKAIPAGAKYCRRCGVATGAHP